MDVPCWHFSEVLRCPLYSRIGGKAEVTRTSSNCREDPSPTSATSKDIASIQPRRLQSVQIRPLQLPHSNRWGAHAAARVQAWPAGGQFRRMEIFCLTADTSLRLICAKPCLP